MSDPFKQADLPRKVLIADEAAEGRLDAWLTATLALPAGFAVTSTSLSGGQVLFYGVLSNGQRKAIVFDIGVGRIVADIAITGN